MAKIESYEVRQRRLKAREAAKKTAVSKVEGALDNLWKLALVDEHGFTEMERQAIANASHEIRGIVGGWVNDRRRR